MMCPFVSDSVVLGINALSTDEEIVLFLGGRRVGDPIPATVITEVNPFSIEPWNSPEHILYLYNLDDGQRKKGSNEIRETKDGYWKTMGEVSKISTGSDVMGRKTALEFHIGNPPFGDKTGWMMHEYQTEWKTCQGIRIVQEYSSLCKVFWQSDWRPEHEEQHSFVDADADAEYLEAIMLSLLEENEGNLSPHYDANSTQAVHGQDQRNGAASDNTMVDKDANLDFINEEYIELNDFDHQESSSSSSNSCNSSIMEMDSNEYFDADALLKELTNDNHTNCKFNISASAKSNQIIIKPSPSGSIISSSSNNNNNNNNKEPPKPDKSPSIRQSSGKSGFVGRITKLGKRYCCFASF
ncbi:NAC domain-containing protein [Dioscorea alata]|nr:NAC domain-containing protein [Dioscorea alata]